MMDAVWKAVSIAVGAFLLNVFLYFKFIKRKSDTLETENQELHVENQELKTQKETKNMSDDELSADINSYLHDHSGD